MGEYHGNLFGVGLEPLGVLLGLVEQAPDVLHFRRRNVEQLLEGIDLFTGDLPVGLGHFGAEYDDGGGKGDLQGIVVFDLRRFPFLHLVIGMAGNGSHDRAQRPAHG